MWLKVFALARFFKRELQQNTIERVLAQGEISRPHESTVWQPNNFRKCNHEPRVQQKKKCGLKRAKVVNENYSSPEAPLKQIIQTQRWWISESWKPPVFAKDAAQVNTPNANSILAIGNLLCVHAVFVVHPLTSMPYRPLGHIYRATTLWPVVNVRPFSAHCTPAWYLACYASGAWYRRRYTRSDDAVQEQSRVDLVACECRRHDGRNRLVDGFLDLLAREQALIDSAATWMYASQW